MSRTAHDKTRRAAALALKIWFVFSVIIGSAGVVYTCGVLVPKFLAGHPSDAEMIDAFRANRQEYVDLLRMFQENKELEHDGRLAGTARAEQYKSLMKRLDVQSVFRFGANGVLFVVSTEGLAVSGSSEGYVYSIKPPGPLVGDTEHDAQGAVGEVYHHIEGHWYVYYSYDA